VKQPIGISHGIEETDKDFTWDFDSEANYRDFTWDFNREETHKDFT